MQRRRLPPRVSQVKPFKFVGLFRTAYPMFAQQSEQGGFQQQDAEECWSTLVSALAGTAACAE